MFARPTYRVARRLDTGDVELRVTHGRKMRRLSLGYRCSVAQWNKAAARFTARMDGHHMKNEALVVVLKRVGDLVDALMRSDAGFSFEEFRKRLRPDASEGDVVTYAREVRDRLKAADRVGNAKVYGGLATMLERHSGGRVIPFEAMTVRWLRGLEDALWTRGCTAGGIGQYMRTLRALLNRAMEDGHLQRAHYPFRHQMNPSGYDVARLRGTHKPRALSQRDLDRLKAMATKADAPEKLVWWMWMYHTRGMNFVDMAYLRWPDIYDGKVNYTRRKTMRNGHGASFRLKLTPIMERILARYADDGRGFIFPVLDERRHRTAQQRHDRVHKCRTQMNKEMRELAHDMGIDASVTTYVARHSFGTTLLRQGVTKEVISAAYGHRNLATTEHYLEQLLGDDLDELGDLL